MLDRRTLQLLSCELSFQKVGGYGRKLRDGWRPTLIFRDSPVCLNFEARGPFQPCERCALFEFVPREQRDALIPCHHIPLNQSGDTLASLYHARTQEQMDQAVQKWLEATIEGLKREENQHESS